MLRTLPFFLVLLLLAGCKTYSIEELPETRLYFGSGGGFAGSFTEYLLLENGQFFKRESQKGDFVALPKVKRSQAKTLFSSWVVNKLGEQDFQHPGNLYHFVRMEEEGKSHRLSWGSSSHPTPDEIKQFYTSCNALIPKVEAVKK